MTKINLIDIEYIPLSREGYEVIINKEDIELIKGHSWSLCVGRNVNYATLAVRCGKESKTIYMHRVIMKASSGEYTDHKNRNGLDNRRINLRIASASQNSINSLKGKGEHSSKYKGVSWRKNELKWQGRVTVNGKHVSLGYFHSEIDCANAYNEAARKYYGEFARLNIIDRK